MNIDKNRDEAIYRCYRLIRRLQQQNRFITTDQDTALSLMQSMALLEVSSGVAMMTDLEEILHLDQSSVSRHVQSLVAKKLVQVRPAPEDSRKKLLATTDKGSEFVRAYSADSNALLKQQLLYFSKEEINALQAFFASINDSLKAPLLKPLYRDHVLRREMRRFTYAAGFLSHSFMGSGLTVGAWQVLSELHYVPHHNSQATLASFFQASISSIASIVQRLVDEKLVLIRRDGRDARVVTLHLSKAGEQRIHQVEVAYVEMLRAATATISDLDLASYLTLFERFVGETVDGAVYLDNCHAVKAIVDPRELSVERWRMIQFLASSPGVGSLSSSLLAPNNCCWKLVMNNEVVAIGEFKIDGSVCSCIHLITVGKLMPQVCLELLATSLKIFMPKIKKPTLVALKDSYVAHHFPQLATI